MRLYNKKQTAFTLIEVLVTVAIIALLTTVGVISFSGSRAKTRDTKRVSDMKNMEIALQMYFNSVGSYPTTMTAGGKIANPNNGIVYLEKIPSNPSPRTDGSCANSDYTYEPQNNDTSYTLNFCLGTTVGDIQAGTNQVTPGGFIHN